MARLSSKQIQAQALGAVKGLQLRMARPCRLKRKRGAVGAKEWAQLELLSELMSWMGLCCHCSFPW
jgi:hypothetical protein